MQRSSALIVYGFAVVLPGLMHVAQASQPGFPGSDDPSGPAWLHCAPHTVVGTIVLDEGKAAPESTGFQATLVQSKGQFDVDFSAKLAATRRVPGTL